MAIYSGNTPLARKGGGELEVQGSGSQCGQRRLWQRREPLGPIRGQLRAYRRRKLLHVVGGSRRGGDHPGDIDIHQAQGPVQERIPAQPNPFRLGPEGLALGRAAFETEAHADRVADGVLQRQVAAVAADRTLTAGRSLQRRESCGSTDHAVVLGKRRLKGGVDQQCDAIHNQVGCVSSIWRPVLGLAVRTLTDHRSFGVAGLLFFPLLTTDSLLLGLLPF